MQDGEQDFSFKSLFSPLTTLKAINLIVIVAIIVFGNMLFNGFVGDDEQQILNNPSVHSILNIPSLFFGSTFYNGTDQLSGIYYRPIMSSFFAIIYSIFGTYAFFFHIFQLLIHIVNAILLYLILRYFFSNAFLSLLLAIIFLIHPINVEAVSYISDLQEILFFFFGSLALYIELRYPTSIKSVSVIGLLLLLSLFSKETGGLFIFVIFLYKLIFNKKSLKLTILVSFVVSLIYIFFRLILAHVLPNIATSSPIMQASLATRLFNIPSILLYYFKTVVFPIHLAIIQMWLVTVKNIQEFYIATIIDIGIIVLIVLIGNSLYKYHKKYFSKYIFFLSWLGLGLLFHSQLFFTLINTVSDRWFYFTFAGLLGAVGVIAQVYFKNFKKLRVPLSITIVVVIIALSFRTIVRNANYYDNYTLYSHDILYSKDSGILENGLGYELIKQKKYKEAELHIVRSLQLDPKGSLNWNSYGILYERMGNIEKAKQGYIKAIQYSNNYLAYQNLALLLLLYEEPQEAEIFTQAALKEFPQNGYLWLVYSLIENKLHHTQVAINAANRAYLLFPSEASYNIYNRLSQGLPIEVKKIKVDMGIVLGICPPQCQ